MKISLKRTKRVGNGGRAHYWLRVGRQSEYVRISMEQFMDFRRIIKWKSIRRKEWPDRYELREAKYWHE